MYSTVSLLDVFRDDMERHGSHGDAKVKTHCKWTGGSPVKVIFLSSKKCGAQTRDLRDQTRRAKNTPSPPHAGIGDERLM
jgi:hypothetical protein